MLLFIRGRFLIRFTWIDDKFIERMEKYMNTKSDVRIQRINRLTLFLKMAAIIIGIVLFFAAGIKILEYLDIKEQKLLSALFAILWGVSAVSLFFIGANWIVEHFSPRWTSRIQPYVFVGPAVLILLWALAVPTVRTLIFSLKDANASHWVGLANYYFAFTDPQMLIVCRNNLLWLILGTSACVILGLVIAVLADRSRYEKIYKSIIFTPMAISFVGAGVIFKFVYNYKGQGNETGLLNAIIMAFGGEPQAWLQMPFWNNIFLIVIMIWIQTGYCMVILSSAIKGISSELLEAARIDGANEFQIFFKVIIPVIRGSIIAVTTTVLIFSLKTFDVVRAMTGGQYGTNVIANEFFNQRFLYYDKGRASAIAIVLLILVIPIMYFNLRQFNERKAF